MVTMLLGGRGTAAGWTFCRLGGRTRLSWESRLARALRDAVRADLKRSTAWGRALSCAVTFALAAGGVGSAGQPGKRCGHIASVAGLNGLVVPDVGREMGAASATGFRNRYRVRRDPGACAHRCRALDRILLLIVGRSHTQQIMAASPAGARHPAGFGGFPAVAPAAASAAVVAAMAVIVMVNLNRHSEFLYFQF